MSTQLNGATQIRSGTIPWAAMAAGAIVPTASLVDGANFIKKDGTVAMTASLNMGGNTVTNAGSPVNASDLTTKAYVDAKTGGIGGIHEVRILGATNIASLTGLSAIDGVTPVAGDLILLIGQTTATQNGPWVAASGAWTRPTWWASASVVSEGQYFLVAEGTTYKETKFWLTTLGTITVDTTSVAFVQDLSGTTYSNGAGLSLTGGVFAVKNGNGIAFDGSNNVTLQLNGTSLANGASGLSINPGTGGQLMITNAGGAAAFTTLSGDATLSNAGVLTISTTAGSGFLKYGKIINNEVPTGSLNGVNVTFTLANTPQNGAVSVFLNGMKQQPGAGKDYTISAGTITMLTAPSATDLILVDYVF